MDACGRVFQGMCFPTHMATLKLAGTLRETSVCSFDVRQACALYSLDLIDRWYHPTRNGCHNLVRAVTQVIPNHCSTAVRNEHGARKVRFAGARLL